MRHSSFDDNKIPSHLRRLGLYFIQVMLYKDFVVEKALTPRKNLAVIPALTRE